jgi:V/A-type H+-transporting ATPase subunit E
MVLRRKNKMAQNIQELTSIIYQEGVQKGEEEAERIIENATEAAENIQKDASAAAAKILDNAQKEADNLHKITESEIKLAGLKAVRAIRQQIIDLITAKAIDGNISKAMSASNIKEYIKIVLKNWDTKEAKQDLELLLPEKEQKELEGTFISEISKLVDNNIEFNFSRNLKGGFQIGPKSGGYKISLTEDNFNEFFKQYLSVKTKNFLFSG